MPAIKSPKVHWTTVGFNSAMKGIQFDAVKTGTPNVDVWITAGFEKGLRKVAKRLKYFGDIPSVNDITANTLLRSVFGTPESKAIVVDPTEAVDPKAMVEDDPLLRWEASFGPEGKLFLYRHWSRGKAILYSNCYAKSHSYMRYLVMEARQVTPDVCDDDIEHHIINNSTHKGMMTCEWPCEKCPKGYTKITHFPTAW